jgi:hypothetical protein
MVSALAGVSISTGALPVSDVSSLGWEQAAKVNMVVAMSNDV